MSGTKALRPRTLRRFKLSANGSNRRQTTSWNACNALDWLPRREM